MQKTRDDNMTLSLCMIVKNEEKVIERCLDSLKDIIDEIIIVDTGSKDNTKKLSKKYTDKIYDFPWEDDFSKARNYAFSKATKDYIMWLDADDIILKKDLIKLKALKENIDKNIDIYMLKYNLSFDETGKSTFSFYRERIIKRSLNLKWIDPVHEFIPLIGKIKKEDIAITHIKEITAPNFRNLKIYKKMKKNNINFTPRNNYYYGRELYDHGYYKKAINALKKFIRTDGWKEDKINACQIINESYKNLNKKEIGLLYLYKSFIYDLPRPKTCCLIGNYYLSVKDYKKAIYWYEKALYSENEDYDGFHENDYESFIPSINLCVCYDAIEDLSKAKYYHELSKKFKPKDKAVLNNEEYFKNKEV